MLSKRMADRPPRYKNGGEMLKANYDSERKDGILVSYKVAAGVLIYKGALVCLNDSGYAVPAKDELGLRLVGVAYERGDNTDGASATVRVWKDGSFGFAMFSPARENLGQSVYIIDDDTVGLDTSFSIFAGTIVEIPAKNIVRILIRNAVR